MAGDWIKIKSNLKHEAEVSRISHACNVTKTNAGGCLTVCWGWLDSQTEDGKGVLLSREEVNSIVELPGFAEALEDVGWLSGNDWSLEITGFEIHI